jgi:hypothetical protein
MASQLSNEELKRLARLGAGARLQQIEDERKAILRAFPGIVATGGASAEARAGKEGLAAALPKKARKRRKRTAAEKKAASERMKKFWAARRQQG